MHLKIVVKMNSPYIIVKINDCLKNYHTIEVVVLPNLSKKFKSSLILSN